MGTAQAATAQAGGFSNEVPQEDLQIALERMTSTMKFFWAGAIVQKSQILS